MNPFLIRAIAAAVLIVVAVLSAAYGSLPGAYIAAVIGAGCVYNA